MRTFYAKVSEEAKLGYDTETGVNEPVYLKLTEAPDTTDENEIKSIISELTNIDTTFITLISEEEYNANVDEEEEMGGCCGCSECDYDDGKDDTSGCCGSCSCE